MQTSSPPNWNGILAISITAVLLVLVAIAPGYVFPQPPTQTQSTTTALKAALATATASVYVKVYSPNGTLLGERSNPNDLILNNLNEYLLALLGAGATGTGCSTLPTGDAAQYGCFAVGSTNTSCPSSPGACGVELGLGNDTVFMTADRANFKLGNQYEGLFADTGVNAAATMTANPSLCHTGTSDEVYDINGTSTAGSATTLTEAGAFLTGYNTVSAGHTGVYNFMIFHDYFSGISVGIGDTINLSYQVNFNNAGFLDNFCYLLAGILTGNILAGGHTNSIYMTTTSGATGGLAEQFWTWCTTGGNQEIYGVSCASSLQAAYEGIGTGSTPFTPASYALTTQVGSYTFPSTRTYTSTLGTATMYWTSTFTVGTSNTITEAGMFMYLTLDATSSQFMIFALTFTGLPESASVPFGISLWITD